MVALHAQYLFPILKLQISAKVGLGPGHAIQNVRCLTPTYVQPKFETNVQYSPVPQTRPRTEYSPGQGTCGVPAAWASLQLASQVSGSPTGRPGWGSDGASTAQGRGSWGLDSLIYGSPDAPAMGGGSPASPSPGLGIPAQHQGPTGARPGVLDPSEPQPSVWDPAGGGGSG